MSVPRDSKKQIALVQLFAEQSDSTKLPAEIHVIPTEEWAHPMYGPMIITAENITEFKKNFDDKVRRDIPITQVRRADRGVLFSAKNFPIFLYGDGVLPSAQ